MYWTRKCFALGGVLRKTRLMPQNAAAAMAPFEAAAHEPIARIQYWNQQVYLVNDHALIHEVLVSRDAAFRKGPVLSVNSRPLLGNGLLVSLGQINRDRRKLVAPSFAHKKVGDYAPVFLRHAEREIDKWQTGQTLELSQTFLAMTMGAMGELLLSADFGGDARLLAQALVVLMNYAVDGLRAPLRGLAHLPIVVPALLYLQHAVNVRIRARRKQGADTDTGGGDLLDMLISGGGGALSNKDVSDEAMNLFLAGMETVAVVLTWAVYLLATHPALYEALQNEADTALNGRIPTPDDLACLPFALGVWKETLRLYPPAYIVARQALEPVMLGGVAYAKGDIFFISPYVQHRTRPEFCDPLAFRPDRWENPAWEKSLPRYAYLPFGGGPHVCVGAHFAQMQGHLLLAYLARRVHFQLVPNQTITPEPLFTLRPKNGIRVTVRLR